MSSFRKCLSVFFAVLMVFGCTAISVLPASAANITENGITYSTNTTKNTAAVIGYTAQSSADEVIIPKEIEGCLVTSISQSAFRFNGKIVSVTLPDTIKVIGGYSFDGCSNLEEINTNNAEITSIGAAAFRQCSKLKALNLGNSLKFIGSAAFKESGIESIVIPDTCETIEGSAFAQCPSLKSAKLPAALTRIESDLFAKSPSLLAIEVPENVTYISTDAFNRCTSLETVKLGNKVEGIGQRAFYGCAKLKDIVLPESLTGLGVNVFWDCNKLEVINIPSGVVSLEFQAFRGCANLKTVSFSQGLEEINDRVFANCESIKNIIIPSTVNSISDSAFINCKDVIIYGVKNSVAHKYANDKGYGFIGYEIDEKGDATITSFDCPGVSKVELPPVLAGAPLVAIANDAFRGNTGLESIELTSSIGRVGEYAFEGCTGLEYVGFAPNSTHIEKYAFANCTSIKNVCLVDGFATIDECAFGFVSSGDEFVPSKDFCIYAGNNSTGQKYCIDNGVQFRFGILKEVATGNAVMGMNCKENAYKEGDKYWLVNLLGDVNADGFVNVKDATHIQKACASLATIDEATEYLADTNLDGKYNVKDATQIQKYVASIIDSFYK